SFLPGYVEAAFYQLAVMMGAPAQPPAPGQAFGLLAGDGSGLIAAQLLHAGLGLGAAILVGRAARLAARRAGARDDVGALAGALAGALFISIPWVIVTGSLAYNEMALLALFAGALIAAMDEGLGPG